MNLKIPDEVLIENHRSKNSKSQTTSLCKDMGMCGCHIKASQQTPDLS